jgi:hypothetical protein
MSARVPRAGPEDASTHGARRLEEVDWMLDAIVGAIAAGILPPDDAFAWAKIAAYEVEMLSGGLSASLPVQN